MSGPRETPPPAPAPAATRPFRRAFRRGLLAATALLGLALLVWLHEALWNRWVRFPREERAWAELRALRQPVPEDAGWPEFRGALHAHSELSHDSEVPFPDILRAMGRARLDFLVLGDHAQPDGRADFSAQWRGLHDGRLLIAGFELRDGFLAFGARPGVTLSNRTPPDQLARQLVAAGGVLFYAHPENPRDWDRPELSGMEIHNLHSDFKRAYGSVAEAVRARLPDLLLSHGRYPEHVARLAFARPDDFLRRWDELNRARPIAGVAGNDAHQNVGFRLVVTERARLRLEDTSPRRLTEFGVPDWLRPALAAAAGPLEPGRRLFTVQFDPYDLSLRYVNTHVLARRLDEPEIVEALRIGRAFVAYSLLADATGFRWFAETGAAPVVMGETAPWRPGTRLRALAPVPGRFTLVRDGAVLGRAEGRAAAWDAPGPGNYRVEVELRVGDDWVPWIFANPVRLR